MVGNARLHPSSSIVGSGGRSQAHFPSDWVLYDEINRVGPLTLVNGATLVTTFAVALFGAHFNIERAVSRLGNYNYLLPFSNLDSISCWLISVS